ncbi:MAG TPA: hypothetical protein VGC54_01280 [Planctomycetota bacterium]
MRMSSIFAVLVGVALAGLFAALGTGLAGMGALDADGLRTHRFLALGGAILIVAVHSMVFVYMIGTGRAIKDAVSDHGIDPALYREHIVLKWQAAPWALACSSLTVATAVLGGVVEAGLATAWLHPLAGLVTFVLNLFGLPAIWRAIRANGLLLDRVTAATAAANHEILARGEDPAPPASVLGPAGWMLLLAASAWLPWLYLRFVMGRSDFPAWPFVIASALCLAGFAREVVRGRSELP